MTIHSFHHLTADAIVPPGGWNNHNETETEPYVEPEQSEESEVYDAEGDEELWEKPETEAEETTAAPSTLPPTTVPMSTQAYSTVAASAPQNAATAKTQDNALMNALFVVVPLLIAAAAAIVGVVLIKKSKRP